MCVGGTGGLRDDDRKRLQSDITHDGYPSSQMFSKVWLKKKNYRNHYCVNSLLQKGKQAEFYRTMHQDRIE